MPRMRLVFRCPTGIAGRFLDRYMSDKKDWAPARIWLQRGVGDDGSHTWCSDSQGEHEQAEYVRVDVQAPAVEADEREVDAHLIDRMSKLLAEIALILNGEPAPIARPSYHDLPDKVRARARDERASCASFKCALAQRDDVPCRDGECERAQIDGAPCWEDDCDIVTRGCAAPSSASEAAEVPAGYKLVPAEPTVEMLNAALPHDVTFGHGFKRRIYQEMIAAALQPASVQQRESRCARCNSSTAQGCNDMGCGYLEAGEQQVARGLSDADCDDYATRYALCSNKRNPIAAIHTALRMAYSQGFLAAKGDG